MCFASYIIAHAKEARKLGAQYGEICEGAAHSSYAPNQDFTNGPDRMSVSASPGAPVCMVDFLTSIQAHGQLRSTHVYIFLTIIFKCSCRK
jgi:hypothetical protein